MMKKLLLILFYVTGLSCIAAGQAPMQTLEYYLQTGISNSPSLKDFSNQQSALHYDSLLVRISRKPQISANGIMLAAPVINGYGYDEAITNGNTFSAVVGFSQELLVKRTNQNQYENIHLLGRSVQNSSQLTRRELKRQIANQFITVWASGKEVAYNYEVLAMLQEQENVVKQLAGQGLYNKAEYLAMQIEIQTQQINIKQLKLAYIQGLFEMNRICGITDTTVYSLTEPAINPVKENPQQLPFFEQFRIDSLKTQNEMEMTRLKYIPKLSWYADAGLNNTDPMLIHKNFGFSAGLNFSMPLNSGKQKNLELSKLSLIEDSRKTYKEFFSKQYTMQVSQLRAQISQYDSLIAMTELQVAPYKELLDADRLLINTGSISVIDFITVLRNFVEVRRNKSSLLTQRLLLLNELSYWLGN
ncbi:MAG: TolC family protein [Bacteroidota bacterium]